MSPYHNRPACVLSIAGSDSGGGAGIQADLKAFARCGVYGMTAITAITAQSTVGVNAVEPISPEAIVAQVEAVAADIGVDAVKIGMLGSEAAVEAVTRALARVGRAPVVVDPVMVAESGSPLSDDATRRALLEQLMPRATVVTPNVAEARMLAAGIRSSASLHSAPGAPGGAIDLRPPSPPAAVDELDSVARAVHELGPACVVVTGGHAAEVTDVFYDGERLERIPGRWRDGGATHGSGCTHSSALAAHLALGSTALEAARAAKEIAEEAVAYGLRGLGSGAGPVSTLGALLPLKAAGAPGGRGARSDIIGTRDKAE
jgi:hydroxymethylpyrimidine/phosphomethylpyrimidine kinase